MNYVLHTNVCRNGIEIEGWVGQKCESSYHFILQIRWQISQTKLFGKIETFMMSWISFFFVFFWNFLSFYFSNKKKKKRQHDGSPNIRKKKKKSFYMWFCLNLEMLEYNSLDKPQNIHRSRKADSLYFFFCSFHGRIVQLQEVCVSNLFMNGRKRWLGRSISNKTIIWALILLNIYACNVWCIYRCLHAHFFKISFLYNYCLK